VIGYSYHLLPFFLSSSFFGLAEVGGELWWAPAAPDPDDPVGVEEEDEDDVELEELDAPGSGCNPAWGAGAESACAVLA